MRLLFTAGLGALPDEAVVEVAASRSLSPLGRVASIVLLSVNSTAHQRTTAPSIPAVMVAARDTAVVSFTFCFVCVARQYYSYTLS